MLRPLSTSTPRNTLFKIYGVLLEDILNFYNIPKPRGQLKNKLHTAFKKSLNIESLTKLSNDELSGYIELIKGYFAMELGIYLRGPKEPENVRDLSLSEYLKTMNKKLNSIYEALEADYNLNSHKERKRFLTDLTGANINLTIGDDNQLIEEVKRWINNN